MNLMQLNDVAVEPKKLATNFADIAFDCFGLEGASAKTEIINRFPLVAWLLSTSATRNAKAKAARGLEAVHKDSTGNYVMEVPRTLWTEPAQSTQGECCWLPFDFAKCAGTVPLNLLCLKDCDEIFDELIGQNTRYDVKSAFAEIAGDGETLEDVKKRVARMSMAFLTAYNVILGTDDGATDILKPFHGLLEVIENEAVMAIYGGNILAGFDQFGCRLSVLGNNGEYVFATNPLTYETIRKSLVKNELGEYPTGWEVNGEEIKFNGIGFIRDRLVPVDMTNGTGEVWVLNGEVTGLFLATDLMPTDNFIRKSGLTKANDADCGSECTYYYNYGAAFNNNSNKLAIITDIPISSVCQAAVADLGGLINPTTLIPEGAEEE